MSVIKNQALGTSASSLQAFLALYDHQSVTVAAESIGLSPGGLSRILKRLETALGTELFTRSQDGLIPTEYAHNLEPYWRRALAALEHGLKNSESFDHRTSDHTFEMFFSNLAALTVLHEVAFQTRLEAPDIRLSITESNSLERKLKTSEGSAEAFKFDFLFTSYPLGDQFETLLIVDEPVCFMASSFQINMPKSLNKTEALEYRFAANTKSEFSNRLIGLLGLNIQYVCGEYASMGNIVDQTACLGIGSASIADQLNLIPIDIKTRSKTPRVQIYLNYRVKNKQIPVNHWLIKRLKAAFPQAKPV